MNADKLKTMEPLFGLWYVETKISEGKNSKFYKVFQNDGEQTHYMGLKTVKFPASEQELSRVISSGKYSNIDEYLDILQQNVAKNLSIMRSLSYHQNIVSLHNYTIISEASCFYVLMLTDILNPLNEYLSFESVSKTDAVKLGCDICRAISAFREKGVIHHNITPENIYVDSNGNYMLGSLGLYDYIGSISEGSLYMAPELYQSTGSPDTSSDIYALGILLYKLLNNNRLPFLPAYPVPISLSDREQSFARCMRGEKFPAPANADFRLSTIISKATAFRADERYISPLAMLSQLETYSPAYTPAPSVPVKPAVNQNTGIHFDSYEVPDNDFTEEEADDVYEETYDDYDDEEPPKKRWYFLIFALLIVLALVVALIVKPGSGNKDKTTTTPTTVNTTEQTTTEETTTEETTTEETTTEETTTEETTTETTTEETTTEETTTEETTTEETTTELTEPYTEPTLVSTNRKNGDKAEDGRTFLKISSYNLEEVPDDIFFDEVILIIGDNLGENLVGTNAYVYQMADSVLIQKVTANIDCQISEDFGGNILCTVTVEDGDFYYEPENYQYFLCFEEGSIVSDSVIILPLQIRI